MNRLLLIFWLTSVLIGCRNAETSAFDETKKEEISNEVRAMLTSYFYDIKQKGLTAEFSYLDNSPDFFWVPPGYNTAISYDSVYKTLQIHDRALKSIDFYWKSLKIHPLSEKIANYTGIVKGTIIDTAENTNQVKMIETGTTIKRTNGWKILSGQSRVLE